MTFRSEQQVLVFGAGVAGLTAAHELIERGFRVTVYERETDWESQRAAFPCAVGGMAKSQWGSRQGEAPPASVADGGAVFVPQAATARPGEGDKNILPGEHGFRFFPGFYRHVFDTMQRIPLTRPGTDDEGPYDRPIRSVYDNLVPTRASGMGLEGHGRNFALEFPRATPKSVREILDTLTRFLQGAGYNLKDISRFTLKLFQYMTSSNLRRREQYEDISWWDFIEGESFSEPMRHDLDAAPAILGALVARKSDARTQGSVSVQLILDQFGSGTHTDALLNGPTTEAWFAPWRDYLKYRGVEFRQGELTDFAVYDDGAKQYVLPKVKLGSAEPRTLEDAPGSYFIVSTALPDLTGRPPEENPRGELQPGLAAKFVSCCASLTAATDAPDFIRLSRLDTANWNVTEDSLLQHLVGVQYFFNQNDRQFVAGHSVYLDSDWRLSAISQTRFWRRAAGQNDAADGILSVDIGNVWKATNYIPVVLHQGQATELEPTAAPCIGATAEQIAQATLQQIQRSTPDNDPMPVPIWFHMDQGLQYDNAGRFVGNHTPYLVNRPGEWQFRPGRLDEYEASHHAEPSGELLPKGYAPNCEYWFLCGTFMKTHTRLTTMEGANESARHAVNGILERIRLTSPSGIARTDPCQVWDIEEQEPEDLRWLKELDERLFKRGLPHAVEILSLDSVPDTLLPALKHLYEPLIRS